MLAASIPPKFPVPFAASAGTANSRSIPVASQQSVQPGAASLTDGFVPLNFVPIAAGGVPPFGQDMNGILHQITLWNQWQAAGGPVKFDATFAAAIAGYPAGALVQSNSGHAIYESLQDNNTADPNTGSTLWTLISCVWSANPTRATGSANVQILTLNPPPTSMAQLVGIPLHISSQGVNTGPTTMNPNGLGAIPILWSGGSPINAGVLTTGAPFNIVYDGFNFIMQTPSTVLPSLTDHGPLIVFGAAVFESSLATAGAASIGSSLGVAGPTFLQSSATIAGPTNFQSSLVIAGSVLCQSTLGVAGGAIFQSTMGVTGQFVCQSAVTAQAFNTASDYRLKIVFGPADVGSLIDKVPVYQGKMRLGDQYEDRGAMFFAHELAEAAPHAVTGTKDGEDSQTVDPGALVPYLWAEIKALRARVAALEAK